MATRLVIHPTLQEARQTRYLRVCEIVIFILSSQRASKLTTRRERAGPRGHCKLKVGARERAGPFVRSNVHREERKERRSREARGQVLQAKHRARETPIIDRAGVGRRTAASEKSGNRVASRRTACTLSLPWNVSLELGASMAVGPQLFSRHCLRIW